MKSIQTGSCCSNYIFPKSGKRRAKIDFLTLVLIVAVGTLLFLLLQGERSGSNSIISEKTSSEKTSPSEENTNQDLVFLDDIDVASQIKEGEWALLLYHHQDPDCADTLSRYQRLAERLRDKKRTASKVALIEVPPYGQPALDDKSTPLCLHGRLAVNQDRTIQTPVELRVRDGIVKATSKNLPGLRSW